MVEDAADEHREPTVVGANQIVLRRIQFTEATERREQRATRARHVHRCLAEGGVREAGRMEAGDSDDDRSEEGHRLPRCKTVASGEHCG